MTDRIFRGFPQESRSFLESLEAHNDRDWFSSHKAEYEAHLLQPAREFVVAMGQRLREVVPEINAEPRVDRSIFRIHRDTRFARDKRPYKTHLGIFFWEGEGAKLESPGFYFQLTRDKLLLGGGLYGFSKEQLVAYREAVDHPRLGPQLARIMDQGEKKLKGRLAAEGYKRVPRGYPADHPRAELLKLKGLTLGVESAIPASIHSARALDQVFKRFELMLPLHRWLVGVVQDLVQL